MRRAPVRRAGSAGVRVAPPVRVCGLSGHPGDTPRPDVRSPRCACSPVRGHPRLCHHSDVHPQRGTSPCRASRCAHLHDCARPVAVSPRRVCLSRDVLTWHTIAQMCAVTQIYTIIHLCPPTHPCAHPDVCTPFLHPYPAVHLPSCAPARSGPPAGCRMSFFPGRGGHRLPRQLGCAPRGQRDPRGVPQPVLNWLPLRRDGRRH